MNALKITTVALALTTGLTAASVWAQGPGRWAADDGNTRGWSLMTPQERTEHQNKMRSFTTYDACKAYQEAHHQAMEARAKEKGVTLPTTAGGYGCDNMRARGFLK
ncbi:MAG: hypothetical protein U5O69_07440 [Candidatus Competibacteraceae bacterium]|nr:hypothetical protein [Candidatus Competibacteraceae bacterium]